MTVWLVAAGLLAGALRIPALERAPLWWDECDSARVINAIRREPAGLVAKAVAHGLSTYFVAMALFVTPGASEIPLRLPSALAGIALVLSLGWMGWVVAGPKLGRTLSLAAAVSPFLVWHAREARWYSLTWLLVSVGAVAFIKLMKGGAWPWAIVALLAGLLAATTYAPAVTVVALEGLWLLIATPVRQGLRNSWRTASRRTRLVVSVALGGTLILLAGWMSLSFVVPVAREGTQGLRFTNVGGPRPERVAYTLVAFATGYTLGPGPAEWRRVKLADVAFWELAALGLGVGALLWLVTNGFLALREGPDRSLASALLGLGLLTGTMVVAACAWSDHAYAPRHAGMAFPFLLCLASAGLWGGPLRRGALASGCLLAVLQAVSLTNLYADPRYQREDVRSAAGVVGEHASNLDLILVGGEVYLPWEHYYRGAAPWRVVYGSNPEGRLAAELRNELHLSRRAWIVYGALDESTAAVLLARELEAWGSLVEAREFHGGVNVRQYRPFPGAPGHGNRTDAEP